MAFAGSSDDSSDGDDHDLELIELDGDDEDDGSTDGESSTRSSESSIELVESSDLSSSTAAHADDDDDDYDELFEFDEDDDRRMSPSLTIVKEVMKRLMRTHKVLTSSYAQLTEVRAVENSVLSGPSDNAEGSDAASVLESSALSGHDWSGEIVAKAFDLYLVRQHYHYLWARLLRLVVDEYDRCSDVYANSLDMQDRLPFESLAHAIHHSTDFCDVMGQIINANYAFGEVEAEETEERLRPVVRQHRRDMEKIQVTATCCGFFVVEGTHESFLDPVTMYDLCHSVMLEPARRKRLISLSLMFSMLDQDDQALMEALSQNVHKVLLQRLRHLVHARFGPFREHTEQAHRSSDAKSRTSRSPMLTNIVICDSGAMSDCSSFRRAASPSSPVVSHVCSADLSPVSLQPTQQDGPGMSRTPRCTELIHCPDSPQPAAPSTATGRAVAGKSSACKQVVGEPNLLLLSAWENDVAAAAPLGPHGKEAAPSLMPQGGNTPSSTPRSRGDIGTAPVAPVRRGRRRSRSAEKDDAQGVATSPRATVPPSPSMSAKRARAESRSENRGDDCASSNAQIATAVAGQSHVGNMNGDFIASTAHERHEHDLSLYDAWTPGIGDYVARGPEWQHGEQGKDCDFGRVVGFVEDDYVIVQWILSPDSHGYVPPSQSAVMQQGTQNGAQQRSHVPHNFDYSTNVCGEFFFASPAPSTRLYKYKYSATHAQVVHWKSYKVVKTMDVSKDTLRSLELMLVCAVAGVLCQQKDTILAALQFQAIDSAVHVLESMDIGITQQAAEAIVEAVEVRARARLMSQREADTAQSNQTKKNTANHSRSDDLSIALVSDAAASGTSAAHNVAPDASVDDKKLAVLLSWDAPLQAVRRRFRDERELLARIGWVLNALLMHKKLALNFLHSGGVSRLLHFMDSPIEVCSLYGCCIILSHMAKVSILEELLRTQEHCFEPMMCHILRQWQTSPSTDVQASAGSFLFHAMSFPCVLHYIDQMQAPAQMIAMFDRNLATSKEHYDVMYANIQLAIFRCLNIYLIVHLMLATRVIFRKHRVLSALVTRSTPKNSLPRDPATVDAVLGFLCAPAPALPDVSAENIASLLTPDRLSTVNALVQQRQLTETLLRGVSFYFQQNRWELLAAGLQALCVLTVIPFVRPLIVQSNTHDLGIAQLLVIINDWTNTFNNGSHNNRSNHNTINGSSNSFRETHLQPCVVAALQILINVTTPPLDSEDEVGVANFSNACGALRAGGGLRVLLEVLRISKPDVSMSAKLHLFPLVARAAQLLVVLRRFKDTVLLFDAMGVHRVAQELVLQYKNVQREYISMMATRKLHTELDPAGRFMENVKSLMFNQPPGSEAASLLELTKVVEYTVDPVEMEQRQGIIGTAIVDYSKQSLLELIARHLDSEGYAGVAHMLRQESHINNSHNNSGNKDNIHSQNSIVMASQLSNYTSRDCESSNNYVHDGHAINIDNDNNSNQNMPNTNTSNDGSNLSLDALVRSFLRQQQESCLHPIETLPQFDLTHSHVYIPAPPPPDDTRNAFHRQLNRRMGALPTLRQHVHERALTYRYPAFMFDITGGGEGLEGQSMAFCDNGESILLGTADGAIAVFDTFPEESSEEKLLEQHLLFDNAAVASLVVSRNGALVAAINEEYAVKVMPRHSLPVIRYEMDHCRAVRFSADSRLLLGTCHDDVHNNNSNNNTAMSADANATFSSSSAAACRVYDLTTGQELCSFHDRAWSIENANNVAVFDPTAQLVLHNAVLWDVRRSDKPVLRFDRVTESFASIFHPLSNQLVIIDEKVWDVRSVRMVHTVPTFHKTSSFHVSEAGQVVYSFRAASGAGALGAMVSAVESVSLETIFSEEMRPPFMSFEVDPSDRYCAAILQQDVESVIRLFSVSSGPFQAEHGAFTVIDPRGEDAVVVDEDEEEEESIGGDVDMDNSSDFYDDDDEEEEESSSATSEEGQSASSLSSSSDGSEASSNYEDSESKSESELG